MRPAESQLFARERLPEQLVRVGGDVVTPKGILFDPRPLARRPIRVLRGGPSGVVVAYGVRAGRVHIDLFAAAPPPEEDVARALVLARELVALDDDTRAFLSVARGHPLVWDLVRAHDVRIGRTPTVFEAFAVAVIEQLVTGFEARASVRRLWRIAGEPVGATPLRAAPRPEDVRRVPMWRLHEIGVGSRRAATLRAGALRGRALERLRDADPEDALARLQSLSGVGPWTANHVAKNALGWADAVPYGDVHAHYLVTEALTGVQGDDDAMVRALEPFRPHRARVVLLVERAIFAGRGLPGVRKPRLPRIDPHRREPWRY